jgi:hypothetical protein
VFALPLDRLGAGSYLLTITAALKQNTQRRAVRFQVR